MNPSDTEVGKFYLITMTDSTQYRVRATHIIKNGVKGKYVPFDNFRILELTGRFPFSKILHMEEI